MGIDIWLSSPTMDRMREENDRRWQAAIVRRDQFPPNTEAWEQAQRDVDALLEGSGSDSLRSSYNQLGMFNVLESIYGIDVAPLLFPGDWEQSNEIDPERFLQTVSALEEAAKSLVDGTPLPIKQEIQRLLGGTGRRHPQREKGEAAGLVVQQKLSDLANKQSGISLFERIVRGLLRMVLGRSHAAWSCYSEPEHGELLRNYLRDLRAFGELAQKIKNKGEKLSVEISF